jgi:O-acetyl-ADP-ribose deacetylase (regulator of RNase III)
MIHEVSGDILLAEVDAIAHGVAPNDDFHEGLALSLRDAWPAMYKDFKHFCHGHTPKAGSSWTWGSATGPRIVALFTQEPAERHHGHGHPGKATESNVNHALKALRKEIVAEGWRSVALPRLATGVGGLDWARVQPMIAHHLGDLDVEVLVVTTYRAGEKPTA